jgi:hypothetical protein
MPIDHEEPNDVCRERISNSCVACRSVVLDTSPAILMPFVAHRALNWRPVKITPDWGLQTIECGMAYTVCNSMQCRNCGMMFLDIRFSDRELNQLYHEYREESYTLLREHYEPGYSVRNMKLDSGVSYKPEIENFLLPYLHLPVSILDWGGDTGKNTPFSSNRHLCHIYDITSKPVVSGATRVTKSVAESSIYDLIVCSNVMEHVPYPDELLAEIRNCMQETTVLYIEVPFENIMRRRGGLSEKRHWHEHINFFSRDALVLLLQRCGFKIIELKELQATGGGNSEWLFMIAAKLS